MSESSPERQSISDPLGQLPRISGREARLERVVRGGCWRRHARRALAWLTAPLGTDVEVGEPSYLDTLSGLKRPGVIAQLRCPSQQATMGLHLETTLAHAIVDRMLGFKRAAGEERFQVTPVEYGILTYTLARCLSELALGSGPTSATSLILDRVGPEPFRTDRSLSYLTLIWPIAVGSTRAEARVWVPQAYLLELDDHASEAGAVGLAARERFATMGSLWSAEAGRATMPRGLARLRVGGVVPIDGFPLRGTVANPSGPVRLVLREPDGHYAIVCHPAPQQGALG